MQKKPWYEWAHRWMQVNSVENDPHDCDLEVWRKYWRDNGIQGTIINAAGTVAYYPSSNPYQYRAKFLGNRDYFADFSQMAREEGLVVIARMDSNQATQELYDVHPDWFCKDMITYTRMKWTADEGSAWALRGRWCWIPNSLSATNRFPRWMFPFKRRF